MTTTEERMTAIEAKLDRLLALIEAMPASQAIAHASLIDELAKVCQKTVKAEPKAPKVKAEPATTESTAAVVEGAFDDKAGKKFLTDSLKVKGDTDLKKLLVSIPFYAECVAMDEAVVAKGLTDYKWAQKMTTLIYKRAGKKDAHLVTEALHNIQKTQTQTTKQMAQVVVPEGETAEEDAAA